MTRAPSWFTGALAHRPASRTVEVNGCDIHYLQWGDPTKPALVLIHGGAAHAHWWSFIAPQLTHHYFVTALDLSGHGDSGRRTAYSAEQWANEVMAVFDDSGGLGRPIIVGHSMGGIVAIVTAARFGEELDGAIMIDAPVRRPDPETEEGERGRMFRNPKTYPDLETAVEHFHLQPPQPCENGFIVDHIARTSLHETPDGWTWKFDPAVFQRAGSTVHEYLADTKCRIALMHGEMSDLLTPDVQEYMEELTGRNAPTIEIPQSYHHVPLDQPLALIAALRAILADWQHTIPKQKLREMAL